MKTALKKVIVGLTILVVACVALFAPRFIGPGATTDLAIQDAPEIIDPAVPNPTEIQLDPASVPASTATATPTAIPAAVIIAAPTLEPDQPAEPTPEPTVEPTTAPTAVPTAEPTPEPVSEELVVSSDESNPAPTSPPEPTATPEPAPEPTATPEPTAEPTAEPLATVEPTPAPTATSEPTATPEPTPEPTATSEPTATPEPTPEPTATEEPVVAEPSLEIDAAWMYVLSTDGLFVRSEPAGQISTVLTYRSQVHITGNVVITGERQWVEIDVPQPGWVAVSFLTLDEPAPPVDTGPSVPGEPPSAADWVAFRNCESGGRYDVVDPSGLYHGAYQFLPSTWDGLARRYWPELVGVLPSQASSLDQDKMANKLFELEGARPWPTCGRFLL